MKELEEFMRNDFDAINMIPQADNIVNYLGTYANCQEKFKLLSGQTRIINSLAMYCRSISSETDSSHSVDATRDLGMFNEHYVFETLT